MIRIITDSASDITQLEAKELGIDVIPLKNRFGDQEYKDGFDITIDEFYNKLVSSEELPTTSCPSPSEFEELFSKYPNDDIVYIALSSKLSGTYQSAFIGKGDRENIYLVDSLSASPGQKVLVYLALDYLKQGLSGKEIQEKLSEDQKNIVLLAMVDTLDYLKKGGRVSSTTAAVGNLLGIKPIITVDNGEMTVIGKARSAKKGHSLINEIIEQNNGIDFTKPYFVSYAGNDISSLDKYLEDSENLFAGKQKAQVTRVGSTIGTHTGPGLVAVTFIKNK